MQVEDNTDAHLAVTHVRIDCDLLHPSASSATTLRQWLEYWDDADSVHGNLRKMAHWLEQAQQPKANQTVELR